MENKGKSTPEDELLLIEVTRLREENDSLRRELKRVTELYDLSQQGIRGTQNQIFEKQLERLRRDNQIDKMTGVFNNNYIEDTEVKKKLEALSREGILFGIIFLDLNDLKVINDSKGHGEGDQYIKFAAQSLLGAVSSRDIVVRKGGDEFIVIVNALDSTTAGDILVVIENRVKNSLLEKNVKASLGVALSADCDHNVQETINLADQRMYAEKRKSKKK